MLLAAPEHTGTTTTIRLWASPLTRDRFALAKAIGMTTAGLLVYAICLFDSDDRGIACFRGSAWQCHRDQTSVFATCVTRYGSPFSTRGRSPASEDETQAKAPSLRRAGIVAQGSAPLG